MSTPSHIVLLNARSGSADPSRAAGPIAEAFAAHGVQARVRSLGPNDDIAAAARDAVAAAPQVVVAGGGDGTINAVAEAVVGSGATLGILPLGTLNHFAKDLGIPLDVQEAVAVACAGRPKEVDVGRVADRLFLNNSSLGLYPRIVRRRDGLMHRLGRSKWLSFAWAAWKVMGRHPFIDVHLVVEDEQRSFRTPLVFVGNNRYTVEGLSLGEREALDEGYLSVHIVGRSDRAGMLALAVRALFGRLRPGRDFESFCTRRVEIATRHDTTMVATDGEVTRMPTPLVYEIQPRALRVLVPAEPS